jgi:iron complex transport system substrate-binding protein
MKKKALSIVILGILVLAGCAKNEAPAKRTLTDRFGKEAAIPAKTDRIISTAPSNTEIITGLGLGDRLVAVDTYSAGIEGIPSGAVQIDFAYPDAEVIIGLRADLIIAAGINTGGTGEDPFRLITEAGIPVFNIPTSNGIEEIYQDIAFIAQLLNAKERGDEIIGGMKRQIAEIAAVGSGISDKRTVYFEISPAPYLYSMGRDTFINQMIEIAGAKNIFDDVTGWIAPSAESIIEKNPDVILSNVNYVDNPIEEIKNRDGFNHISAVSNSRVYLIDGDSSARPSQHILLALKQIAKAVYPDAYAGW